MNPHPFRHMRLTLRTCMAHVQLLLSLPHIEWGNEEYARFMVMVEMYKATESRTYPQAIGELGAWMRFYRRLVQRLAESEAKTAIEAEFDKVVADYQDLLEVQPSKQ